MSVLPMLAACGAHDDGFPPCRCSAEARGWVVAAAGAGARGCTSTSGAREACRGWAADFPAASPVASPAGAALVRGLMREKFWHELAWDCGGPVWSSRLSGFQRRIWYLSSMLKTLTGEGGADKCDLSVWARRRWWLPAAAGAGPVWARLQGGQALALQVPRQARQGEARSAKIHRNLSGGAERCCKVSWGGDCTVNFWGAEGRDGELTTGGDRSR
jgi:hypothetical protein